MLLLLLPPLSQTPATKTSLERRCTARWWKRRTRPNSNAIRLRRSHLPRRRPPLAVPPCNRRRILRSCSFRHNSSSNNNSSPGRRPRCSRRKRWFQHHNRTCRQMPHRPLLWSCRTRCRTWAKTQTWVKTRRSSNSNRGSSCRSTNPSNKRR